MKFCISTGPGYISMVPTLLHAHHLLPLLSPGPAILIIGENAMSPEWNIRKGLLLPFYHKGNVNE